MRVLLCLFLLLPLLFVPACASTPEEERAGAIARQVTSRIDLIGGDRALGEVGDFLLENDRVRIVIQAPGFSRGFGVFGGSIIDADVRRVGEAGSSAGGSGLDQLGELFPAFFLQAVAVEEVVIENDGRDGRPARIRATGFGGDFLTLVSEPVRQALGEPETGPERWRYDIFYELGAGENWVTVTLRATNVSAQSINPLSNQAIAGVFRSGGINNIPVGDVALFGDTSKIFAPGFGFDLRFGLQRAYAAELPRQTFPGLIAPWLVTRSEAGVSYGYAVAPSNNNFAWNARRGLNCGTRYDALGVEVDRSTLLLPFVASGFVGVFYDSLPRSGAATELDATPCERSRDCESGERCARIEARHDLEQGPLPEGVEPPSAESSDGEESAAAATGWCGPRCAWDGDCEEGLVCEDGGCLPIAPPACTGTDRLRSFAPGQFYEATKYLVIGEGIPSVMDTIQRLHNRPTGELTGEVLDAISGAPAGGAEVFLYTRRDAAALLAEAISSDASDESDVEPPTIEDLLGPEDRLDNGQVRKIWMHADVEPSGFFRMRLPPGDYSARVIRHGALNGIDPQTGEDHTRFVDFTIREDERTSVRLQAPEPGRVVVRVFDSAGNHLPAKTTAVGVYDAAFANENPQHFLYDLRVRESFRNTDMLPDDPDDPMSRRYIEASAYTDGGIATLTLRPGTYTLISSRGPEYEIEETEVTVEAGRTTSLTHRLDRSVPMDGWIAADLHIHTIHSIDSSVPLDRQIRNVAGEGVAWAVSTDHNFVTDFAPTIARLGLQDWMISSVGLELTTLEAGHFNAYPLRYEVGPITHGAFEWASRPPDDLFADLRSLGKYGPENVIIQVNHPRDSIIGYFDQFRRDGLSFGFLEPSNDLAAVSGPAFYELDEEGQILRDEEGNRRSRFSLDFEVLEIINGKRLEQLRHYRIPTEVPDGIREQLDRRGVNPGEILLESNGRVAFPGAVDDWFNTLNLGHRFIGVGNSDTHGDTQEAGYPRTMIWTGESDVRLLSELDLVNALRSRRVFTTNGPMVDFWIDDPVEGAMGSEIRSRSGEVDVHVQVRSASWLSAERINLYRNGQIADIHMIDPERDYLADPWITSQEVPEDSWFLVEVIGYESMFPVVRPDEVPSLDLTDAVGALAGPLGLDGGGVVDVEPDLSAPVQPYAITNPIWVRTGSGDWQAPGIPPREELISADNDPGLNQNPTTLFLNPDGTPKRVRLPDVRLRPYADATDADSHEAHEEEAGAQERPHRAAHHGHAHDHPSAHHPPHDGASAAAAHGYPDERRAWEGEVPGEAGIRRHIADPQARINHPHHHHHHLHLPLDEVPRSTYDLRRLFDLFCDGH